VKKGPAKATLRQGLTLVEMAIVILVLGILIGVMMSAMGSMSVLKTTEEESAILKDVLISCRDGAIFSNQTVYLEFDLDKRTYEAYRFARKEGEDEPERDVYINKRELSASNSIIAIIMGAGTRITSGQVTLAFAPEGMAEELVVYMGPGPEIRNTVIYSKYGGTARVEVGEKEHQLEDPDWSENLEE